MTRRTGSRYEIETYRLAVADPGPLTPAGTPDHAVQVLRTIFADLDADQEHFVVLALDNKSRVTGFKVVHTGTLTSSLVHPREVLRATILLGAAKFIVAHNHPSNDPTPSEEDLLVTRRLEEAGRLVGIPLADHIILGVDDYISLKRVGGLAEGGGGVMGRAA